MENIKLKLAKSNCSLLSRCNTPMATTYYPSEEVKKEIYSEELQVYQELICIIHWAVEIGRVYILLEVSFLSSQLALPCEGHIQVIYRVFGYLKQVPKRKLYFDPRKPMIF